MEKKDFVDQIGRRKWDLKEYAEREAARLAGEEPAGGRRNAGAVVVRKPLKSRTYALDLASRVGQYSVVTASSANKDRGGFFCETCDCVLKDSNSYLDHINGKKHQQNLGMNMRPERATLGQVKDRLKMHKKRKEASKKGSDIAQRLKKFEDERAAKKRRKKDRKKRRKRGENVDDLSDEDKTDDENDTTKDATQEDAPEDYVDPAMAAMGFGFSFGGSKKNR